MFVEFMRCPACDAILGDGDKIYVRNSEVLGCDNCIEEDYADSEDYEDDEEERYADYCDMLNDLAREERVFG